MAKRSLTVKQAIRIAWMRGLLKYKLYEYQKDLYDILEKNQSLKLTINSSRRWGKSTVLLLYGSIFAIKNPNSQVKIAAPTIKSLRKTIFPIMKIILADKPEQLKFEWSTKDECYNLWNGSQIHIHATDAQRHDGLRGNLTHLALVDEAAYCSDLKYVVQDILLPQTLTCNGRVVIASTPSKNVTQSGEEFKEFCQQAEANGSYFCRTIYDNKSLTPEIIELYKQESGGEESVTWQVEYLCKFMVDPEKRLVPEWNSSHIKEYPKMQDRYFRYWHKYLALDLGVKRDFTVMLYGVYNFKEATLYITHELTMKNMTTKTLVEGLLQVQKEAFEDYPIYRAVADTDNPLLLNDLVSLHNIAVQPTDKSTLETMVNELRVFVGNGKLKVSPRCTFLLGSLEHGVWADNAMGQQRRDFGRTPVYGHFDAIAALMYLIRNLDQHSNPLPLVSDGYTTFIPIDWGKSSKHKELDKLFKKRK
jgi:hypothetical protein